MEPWELSDETGNKNPSPFKDSPPVAQLPVKCLICVKEIPPRPDGSQILVDEESAVILLYKLFKLLQLSPLVCRYLLKEISFPNVTLLYCKACKESVSNCLKISKKIDHLRNLLEGLTCKIKEDFLEGYYCRPDANCGTTKIRKTLVQCWTTSTVKIQKLPPSNNSKNNTCLNDELKLSPSPVEQNTNNEGPADIAVTGNNCLHSPGLTLNLNKCLSNIFISDSNPTTSVNPDNSDGDEFIEVRTPRSPSPVISELISESDKNELDNVASVTFQSKDLFVSSTETGSIEEVNTESKLIHFLGSKPKWDVNPSPTNADSRTSDSDIEMIRQAADEFLSSILNDNDSQVMNMAMDQGSTTIDNAAPVVGYHQTIPHPPHCACAFTNGTTSITAPPFQYPSAFEDHQPNNASVSLDSFKRNYSYSSDFLEQDNISLSQAEKLLSTLNLSVTQEDVIHLPIPELRQRLYKYGLSRNDILVLGGIRRTGRNRIYARNCRNRRFNHIRQLKSDIQKLRDAKTKLVTEQKDLLLTRNNVKQKLSQLHHTVFQALRDEEGNPYSPYEYYLQQGADGNIVLVPRNSVPAVT